MERLGEQHITFLRSCAAQPWRKHPSDLPVLELQRMVDEGLLIKYSGNPGMYAITKIGSQVASTFGASAEMMKMATDFVISRGYTQEAAEAIISQYGAEEILKDMAQTDQRQREVKIPLDAQGKSEIKFRG